MTFSKVKLGKYYYSMQGRVDQIFYVYRKDGDSILIIDGTDTDDYGWRYKLRTFQRSSWNSIMGDRRYRLEDDLEYFKQGLISSLFENRINLALLNK